MRTRNIRPLGRVVDEARVVAARSVHLQQALLVIPVEGLRGPVDRARVQVAVGIPRVGVGADLRRRVRLIGRRPRRVAVGEANSSTRLRGVGVVCCTVGEDLVHVLLGPALESAHQVVQ